MHELCGGDVISCGVYIASIVHELQRGSVFRWWGSVCSMQRRVLLPHHWLAISDAEPVWHREVVVSGCVSVHELQCRDVIGSGLNGGSCLCVVCGWSVLAGRQRVLELQCWVLLHCRLGI